MSIGTSIYWGNQTFPTFKMQISRKAWEMIGTDMDTCFQFNIFQELKSVGSTVMLLQSWMDFFGI